MSVTVTLGMVTWNLGSFGPLSMAALVREQERMIAAGWEADLVLVDNASDDGTADVARDIVRRYSNRATLESLEAPVSATTARNHIVDMCEDSDYLMFVDGDIEVIPHSGIAMVHYLILRPLISAIAMDPLNQQSHREGVTTYCKSIENVRRDPLMYLCGYGMFARGLYEHLGFDEHGPLGQCGWGAEDDDFWFQMVDAGYDAVYAEGFTFHHPEPRSSWKNLSSLGVDPQTSFEKRKQYVLQKWRERRSEPVAPLLALLGGQHV